ncbi:hypothetical protein FQN53_003964 [Emmonsiellopsis sp. PD_33]|nr:hypothetical protein FQN53_003964 [Emmonsiellopsis sp. PD_33]
MEGRILPSLKRWTLPVLVGATTVLAGRKLFYEHCFSIETSYGPSMYPTIPFSKSWLIVSKFHKHGKNVQVGDIVVARNPRVLHQQVAKRVLGMPGDYVLKETPSGDYKEKDAEMIRVPEGHVWIVGDNLPWSRDSREYYGPVPMGLICGKVVAQSPGRIWQLYPVRNTLQPLQVAPE